MTQAPPTRKPTTDPGEAMKLLERQASLYERLTACGERQRAMIECDRVDPLLQLLAERKKITTELMELSEELAPVRNRWSAFCDELDDGQRCRARHLMDRAGGALKKLLALDEEDARLLHAKKADTAGALKSLPGRSGAISAYRSADTRPHRLDAVHQET